MSCTFQITRHSPSCNNYDLGERTWLIYNKDLDPSITIYGIFQTIHFATRNKDDFISNTVYVSNLVRTWMTSVLLYGTGLGTDKDKKNNLNICISPYLKEFHKHGIKRGNYPLEAKEIVDNFTKFLEQLYSFKMMDKDDFDEMVTKIFGTDVSMNRDKYKKWFDNLPNIILKFPLTTSQKNKKTFLEKIVFNHNKDKYEKPTENSPLTPVISPSGGNDSFLKNGDLRKFIKKLYGWMDTSLICRYWIYGIHPYSNTLECDEKYF